MPESNQDPGGSNGSAAGRAGRRGATGREALHGEASLYARATQEYIVSVGGAVRAVRRLLKNRDGLRAKLDKSPPVHEGAVVLIGDDAAARAKWQKLGAKPAAVKKQLDELPALRAFKADREQADQMATAGKAVGFKGSVLADQMKATLGAKLEQRPVTVQDGRDAAG